MGAGADGITRQEFLTPPEFRHLPGGAHPTGRVGGARLELYRHAAATRLGRCYEQIPLRVTPLDLAPEPALLVYLITLTAGLMDGDGHLLDLTAGPGTRAVVTGQSATRVHPALVGFATQQWDVRVAEDACLVVLPGPAIPYAGCRYHQRGRVELAPTARLVWGDIWLPGRYDRAGAKCERFRFDRIVQDLEVRRAGRLVYRDRFRWDGPWSKEEADWHFGGHLAAGSLFAAGPLPAELPPAPAAVQRSVFPLESGDSCVRWCGPPGDVTADLVRVACRLAADWTGGPAAPPWLLESSELAPNHWFSVPAKV